jgi:hypothetical protein
MLAAIQFFCVTKPKSVLDGQQARLRVFLTWCLEQQNFAQNCPRKQFLEVL